MPLNPTEFKTVTQNETSVTLQWKKVDDIINYVLVFSGEEINVSASAQDEVIEVISNLTNMTKYDFSLFAVFENIRSSGVNHTAFTGKRLCFNSHNRGLLVWYDCAAKI